MTLPRETETCWLYTGCVWALFAVTPVLLGVAALLFAKAWEIVRRHRD